MTLYSRVRSRVILVPFEKPSCGPVTAEESRCFMEFVGNCDSGKYSSIVGWVVKQGKILMENDCLDFRPVKVVIVKNSFHIVP